MKLILLRGRPGAGKTTISNILSKETNFPILRKDDIYDVTAEFVSDHPIRNKISYNSLYQILKSSVHTNCTYIVDYPFQSPGDVAIIKKWCRENNVEL